MSKQQQKKPPKAKQKQLPKLKTKKIEVDVDKLHALVIKEYDGMVLDVFTKKPVEMFMKPLSGYKVSRLFIEIEQLPPIEAES